MHISFLVSFLRSGGSSGAANLGQELNSVRTIGRSKDKERIGNLRGQVPVGEISPELRLPGFILVGDHNPPGQRLAALGKGWLPWATHTWKSTPREVRAAT